MTEVAPPTPQELREATLWRILRAIYLRVECSHSGRSPVDLKSDEQEGILDRWHPQMGRDVEMLREVVLNAMCDAEDQVRRQLHGSAVQNFASHGLLEQVIGAGRPAVEAPLMDVPRHARGEKAGPG